MKKLLLNLLLIGASVIVNAQTIITDRPDQTEASSSVEKGMLQIESGLLVGFTGDGQNSQRQILAPTTLLRYGVTEAVELRFLNQFETFKQGEMSFTGISDFELGTKIELLKKENINTEIAVMSHLVLPTGSKELTSGKIGTINKISISHGLTENTSLGYNIGYDYFAGTSTTGNLTYSLAYGLGINDKVGAYIEPFGEFTELETLQASFDMGFTYLPKENIQLDFSYGFGLNHRMNYASIGVSWYMKRKP